MKSLLLILIFLLMSGCGFQSPAITEYSLLTAPTKAVSPYQSIHKNIKIATPSAPSSLASKSIHYITSAHESGNYLYSKWSDTPSTMIENSLFQSLQESHLFTTVSPSFSLAQSDYLLESNLLLFHHHINENGTSSGVIDISFRLIDLESKKVLSTKHFTLSNPAQSKDAKGGTLALHKSLEEINIQVVEWLNSTLHQD